jgi:hypothetical protein
MAVAFCGDTMPENAIWERAAIYKASHSNERIRRLEKFRNWVLEIHRLGRRPESADAHFDVI